MKTTTATVINEQSLSHYYIASSFTESSFEVLNDMKFEVVTNNIEFDLENILLKDLQQGLLTDILSDV